MDAARALVLDVDGVLTDGRIYYGPGGPMRAFDVQDGIAILWFQKHLGEVALLTGLESESVRQRATDLKIAHVIQGSRDKLSDLRRLAPRLDVPLEEIAYIGDDLPDLAAMTACGWPIAPANAREEVRRRARVVTRCSGGRGAVREAIEWLLRRAGKWQDVLGAFARSAG